MRQQWATFVTNMWVSRVHVINVCVGASKVVAIARWIDRVWKRLLIEIQLWSSYYVITRWTVSSVFIKRIIWKYSKIEFHLSNKDEQPSKLNTVNRLIYFGIEPDGNKKSTNNFGTNHIYTFLISSKNGVILTIRWLVNHISY